MRNLLQKARIEILELRSRNELLSAQVGVVEVFAAALGLRRGDGQPMCVDVAWEIQRKIDELIDDEKRTGDEAGQQNAGSAA